MEVKLENLSKGQLIKADIYSRPNAIIGKYRAGQIGLDNLESIKDSDIFFLETLKIRADSADKINALGKPIHRSESVMTAIMVSLTIILCYGIAIGIWGLVFSKNFFSFGLYGATVGLLISLLFVTPVIAVQRTKERIKNTIFGVDMMITNIGIVIGILGLI